MDQPEEDEESKHAQPQHETRDEPEPSTSQPGRRGREHLLLHKGNAVAKGSPLVDQKVLHGHTFGQTTQSYVVVAISSVIDR